MTEDSNRIEFGNVERFDSKDEVEISGVGKRLVDKLRGHFSPDVGDLVAYYINKGIRTLVALQQSKPNYEKTLTAAGVDLTHPKSCQGCKHVR